MKNAWALVTGASSGIGWATALRLAEAGYNLYLIARREDRLKELADLVHSQNPSLQVRISSLDIRNGNEVDDFFRAQNAQLENVEVLVNNAGLARGTEKLQDGNRNDWDEMFDTNVRGLLYFTRGLLPFMIKRKSGSIFNIGSVAGRWVYPGGAVYCASKFAVRAISEGLRMDLLGHNIRVTNIEPGMVETEFSKVRFQDEAKAKKVYEGMRPLLGEDIADTIIWCLQRPPHVTIQELVVFPTDQAAVGMVHRQNESVK